MTNDTRSPAEIEREIEEQRSDLSSNLEDLQDKFSIDAVVHQFRDHFREHGGDIGRSISQQVKANPVPLALTGIGLAWMMFGNSQKPAVRDPYDDPYEYDRYSSAERNYRRARLEQGRPYTPPTSHVTHEDDRLSWARDDDDDGYDDGPSVGERLSSGVSAAKSKSAKSAAAIKDGASNAASAVSDTASNAASTVSNTASKAGSRISDAAGSAKSAVASGAQSVQSGIAAAGSRIADGTETLSEEGRKRVIAARQKALELRRKTARSMSSGADAASDFYDRQPLVVGALALAVGAALGGAMPRTKTEDDLMGEQSDDLFREAERIFEEEKAKAASVAKSVKDEVKDIAAETKADLDRGAPGDKSAVEAVGDKAKSMAERVTDTAKTKAKSKKLGKPKT